MTILRDQFQYQQLMEIAGVDYPGREERFDVVYHLLSVTKNHRIRVHVCHDKEKPVPPVPGLWPLAGRLEREGFNMYGVLYSDNPALSSILTHYGLLHITLRKHSPTH